MHTFIHDIVSGVEALVFAVLGWEGEGVCQHVYMREIVNKVVDGQERG
jgi:hypothetical protein